MVRKQRDGSLASRGVGEQQISGRQRRTPLPLPPLLLPLPPLLLQRRRRRQKQQLQSMHGLKRSTAPLGERSETQTSGEPRMHVGMAAQIGAVLDGVHVSSARRVGGAVWATICARVAYLEYSNRTLSARWRTLYPATSNSVATSAKTELVGPPGEAAVGEAKARAGAAATRDETLQDGWRRSAGKLSSSKEAAGAIVQLPLKSPPAVVAKKRRKAPARRRYDPAFRGGFAASRRLQRTEAILKHVVLPFLLLRLLLMLLPQAATAAISAAATTAAASLVATPTNAMASFAERYDGTLLHRHRTPIAPTHRSHPVPIIPTHRPHPSPHLAQIFVLSRFIWPILLALHGTFPPPLLSAVSTLARPVVGSIDALSSLRA